MRVFALVAVVIFASFARPAAAAPPVSFGDDLGEYTNDGECDDPRFIGKEMTDTPLLSEDILHDAKDCRTAYQAGQLTLRGVADDGAVDFGNDAGDYTKDGECDDMRFTGPPMQGQTLISDSIMHDASDCRPLFKAGKIRLHLK